MTGVEAASGGPVARRTRSEQERLAAVGLSRLVRPTHDIVVRLVRDGLEETWRWCRNRARASGRTVIDPQRDLDAACAVRAGVVLPGEPGWPGRLDDLRSFSVSGATAEQRRAGRDQGIPFCLWVRGSVPLDDLADRAVAVVGARAATDYGRWVAGELAVGLAERDATVISGGAFGIDAAAHRGALAGGGKNIAVLAGGVDIPYPRAHEGLLRAVADAGALVSEVPPGTAPQRAAFLVRNRLIAALSPGVVLVEAGMRSGARNTVAHAAALDRVRMVVPGPVSSAMSTGCHVLLREDFEARLVTSAQDVLEETGRLGADLAPARKGPADLRDELGEKARALLEALPARGVWSVGRIAGELGVSGSQALGLAGALADHGLLLRAAGGFELTDLGRAPSRR